MYGTVILCEKCEFGSVCKILNPYKCSSTFVPALNSNFGPERKVEQSVPEEPALIT